jgi:hypothetical protein
MIEMDISFTIIGVPMTESPMITLWSTLEDTGTVTKKRVLWTNMKISIALVNCDFPRIKLETVKEE